MKNTKFLLTGLLIFNCMLLFSQGEFIVEIDRVTGHYTKPGPAIPGCNWVYTDIQAYDEVHSRYFFHGGTINPDHFYSIHATDGTVDYSPPFSNASECEFDNSTGILYELHNDQGQSQYFLDTINPQTGNETAISSTPVSIGGTCQGFSAFDEGNHRYVTVSGNTIFCIDASTGVLVFNTPLGLLSGEELCCPALTYDRSSGVIYSILWDQASGNYFLASVDPSTGAITKIGAGSNLLGFSGSMAVDTGRHQVLYLYPNQLLGGYTIATLDIATGSVVYNQLIGSFTTGDNFWGVEFDHALDKVYAMYWQVAGFSASAANLVTDCGSCNGAAQVNPFHGTSPYTYLWSDGETTAGITGVCAGVYSVTVTDVNHQSAVVDITIPQSSMTPVNIQADQNAIICATDSLLLCPGSTYSNYVWNTGATSSCIYASAAGNYYLTATDNNGCSAESNHVGVSVYPQPSVAISVNGDTLTAYNAVTYQWYLNGNKIDGATSASYVANAGGSYTVAVTDTNGCMALSTGIVVPGVSGIDQLPGYGFSIYPNPALGNDLVLEVENNLVGNVLEINDVQGRLVLNHEIGQLKSILEFNVLAGVYFFTIRTAKGTVVRKIVKL